MESDADDDRSTDHWHEPVRLERHEEYGFRLLTLFAIVCIFAAMMALIERL